MDFGDIYKVLETSPNQELSFKGALFVLLDLGASCKKLLDHIEDDSILVFLSKLLLTVKFIAL